MLARIRSSHAICTLIAGVLVLLATAVPMAAARLASATTTAIAASASVPCSGRPDRALGVVDRYVGNKTYTVKGKNITSCKSKVSVYNPRTDVRVTTAKKVKPGQFFTLTIRVGKKPTNVSLQSIRRGEFQTSVVDEALIIKRKLVVDVDNPTKKARGLLWITRPKSDKTADVYICVRRRGTMKCPAEGDNQGTMRAEQTTVLLHAPKVKPGKIVEVVVRFDIDNGVWSFETGFIQVRNTN